VMERGKHGKVWRCIYSAVAGNFGLRLEANVPVGWPVIGAVPGTPAAEQHHEPVSPDGPSGQPFPPLPDPHVPVVLKRADTAPRVFPADGPEPPVDVNQVRDKDGALLSRVSDADLWIGEGGWSEGRNTYSERAKPWCEHVLAKYEPYTEVLP